MNIVKLLQLYPKYGIKLVKGYMQYVWDGEGKKYLDCHAGYGTMFLGHCNPKIVNAITEQLHRLITVSYSFDNDSREECLRKLSKILPKNLNHVFFQSTGTEAVEAALKFSRKYSRRKKFVAFKGSFHGRTMGALSITWNLKYRKPFEPMIRDTVFIDFNNVDEVYRVVDDETAAVIVEPIQGEGGINEATFDFLRALRVRADEVGCVLVFDEIQCGFGRTGKIWAHQHHNIKPDIITAGKSIGGGYPVSLVAVREEIASSIDIGEHGTTYGGNPVACKAVSAAIDVLLDDNVADRAMNIGAKLKESIRNVLQELKLNFKVKGKGLMLGIDLRKDPYDVIYALRDHGILSIKAGETVLRFLPPYMINEEDVDLIVSSLRSVLKEKLMNKKNS